MFLSPSFSHWILDFLCYIISSINGTLSESSFKESLVNLSFSVNPSDSYLSSSCLISPKRDSFWISTLPKTSLFHTLSRSYKSFNFNLNFCPCKPSTSKDRHHSTTCSVKPGCSNHIAWNLKGLGLVLVTPPCKRIGI